MGNGVFNAAKGRLAHFVSLPAASDALVVVLLKAAGLEPDDALNNHTSLAAVLAASNDEADFTTYAPSGHRSHGQHRQHGEYALPVDRLRGGGSQSQPGTKERPVTEFSW